MVVDLNERRLKKELLAELEEPCDFDTFVETKLESLATQVTQLITDTTVVTQRLSTRKRRRELFRVSCGYSGCALLFSSVLFGWPVVSLASCALIFVSLIIPVPDSHQLEVLYFLRLAVQHRGLTSLREMRELKTEKLIWRMQLLEDNIRDWQSQLETCR